MSTSSPLLQNTGKVTNTNDPSKPEATKTNTATAINSIDDKKENANMNLTVAVTGASGFIAAHCINQLLAKGYNVRGSVRGDPHSDKYQFLYDLSAKHDIENKIELYQADLLQTGSFDACFQNVDYIFHIASPFVITVKDAITDLVEPAINGTLNVLNSALNANNAKLKRIVLTSSVAAINGYTADPNKLYTEQDWNDESTADYAPYYYSKTEAERAAWNWMDSNKTKISFDLITVLPSLVLGKHLNPKINELNQSNQILTRVITGEFPIVINIAFTLVDVRDVAAMHIFMIEDDAKTTASGRYICGNEYMPLSVMMDACKQYCDTQGIKTNIPCCRCDCNCCWCFIMCVACCRAKEEAEYLRSAVNKGPHYCNEKITKLGFEFRNYNSTLMYTLDYLYESGYIGK